MPVAPLAVLCGVIGLAVGSFLNVVVHRVPARQSLVHPRSRCPRCETPIASRDNVPVVSWLVLRGRCRHCREPIALRYPLVEAGTALLWAAVAVRLGWDWALPGFLFFASVLVAVSLIDLEHYIIPNRIVFPALAVALPLLAAAAAAGGEWDRLARALIGSVAASGGLLIINLVHPRGMGMGDVKLALLLGLFLGWLGLGHVAVGLFLGFLSGAVVGLLLILLRLRRRTDHVPFGPFLALGALTAVLAGRPLLDWYLGG